MPGKLTKNAMVIMEKRYLKKDSNGKVSKTHQELFSRVAKAVAKADKLFPSDADNEKTEKKFFNMMTGLRFIPNSPTLMNAGRKLGQLAACFVPPIEDSMESVFKTLKNAAIIHKSGGGTGFPFSRIRPAADVSSGPVSFMSVFDMAAETVKQGGT